MRLPRTPPDHDQLLKEVLGSGERLQHVMALQAGPLQGNRYLHWDDLVYRTPPGDLTHREWWAATTIARLPLLKPLPLTDKSGVPFVVAVPDPALEMIHAIDRNASGRIALGEPVTNPATREQFLVKSLMEEAITSSQLEGAATTSEVARDMIRSGREPRNKDERMIVNNYQAMEFIRRSEKQTLTPEMIFELHRIVTEATLEDPGAAGRLRRASEPVAVWDPRDRTLLHEPPPAGTLPDRLRLLCEFANARIPETFLHPVVRAIILHFWVGYDHPFKDGNGRTARALFYWSMLAQGYWLCEYLSISSVVKRAPAKYMRAYLHSETDRNDLTYFLLYHLRVVVKAIQDLHRYLDRKVTEFRQTAALLRRSDRFNHRQIALLTHALRHPGFAYNIQSHRVSHRIVYQTARADLLGLAKEGLLDLRKSGRTFYFYPPEDLAERLEGRSKRRRR